MRRGRVVKRRGFEEKLGKSTSKICLALTLNCIFSIKLSTFYFDIVYCRDYYNGLKSKTANKDNRRNMCL